MKHHVRVGPLPPWLDRARLLGEGAWAYEGETASAELNSAAAADVSARLRGVGVGGRALAVTVEPPLKRPAVRAARTDDARRRRDTTPGFLRPGTRLDDEGRMSLTPEALAARIAKRVEGLSVLDAGCGAGGTAIAFARAGCRVVAVEQDRERLEDARHNAEIYGVDITWVAGEAVAEARVRTADVLFVDPPWGADWDRTSTLLADLPLLEDLIGVFREGAYGRLIAKVPPSFDPTSTPDAVPEAIFGEAGGDFRRIKFVLLTW